MFNRHKHVYKVFSVAYVAPVQQCLEFQGRGALDKIQSMMSGSTNVALRCQECGDLKQYSLRGEHKIEVEWGGLGT